MGKYGTAQSDGKTIKLNYYDPAEHPLPDVLDSPTPNRTYLSEQLNWKEETWDHDDFGGGQTFHDDVAECLNTGRATEVSPEDAASVILAIDLTLKSAGSIRFV
jgi:hypothetical protein